MNILTTKTLGEIMNTKSSINYDDGLIEILEVVNELLVPKKIKISMDDEDTESTAIELSLDEIE